MANFGINGFGRIGRNVLRAMKQKQVERIRAINDLTDTHTLAHLLKWDSVHGRFDGEISYDNENIIVRGHKIKVLKERDPGALPWKDLGVDVVLESTGFFTSRDKAELHISKGGAKRVLISAPAKNPDATICVGINDDVYDAAKHTIVSNASCTTNCLAPLAKVLNDAFGIEHGFMGRPFSRHLISKPGRLCAVRAHSQDLGTQSRLCPPTVTHPIGSDVSVFQVEGFT